MLLAFLTTVYSSPYIRKLETDGCVDNPDFNCELYAYKWDCNYNAKVMLACPAKCQERGYRDCGVSDGCVDKANFDCATRAFEWHCQNDEEVMSSCCFTCRVNGSGENGWGEATTKGATGKATTKATTTTSNATTKATTTSKVTTKATTTWSKATTEAPTTTSKATTKAPATTNAEVGRRRLGGWTQYFPALYDTPDPADLDLVNWGMMTCIGSEQDGKCTNGLCSGNCADEWHWSLFDWPMPEDTWGEEQWFVIGGQGCMVLGPWNVHEMIDEIKELGYTGIDVDDECRNSGRPFKLDELVDLFTYANFKGLKSSYTIMGGWDFTFGYDPTIDFLTKFLEKPESSPTYINFMMYGGAMWDMSDVNKIVTSGAFMNKVDELGIDHSRVVPCITFQGLSSENLGPFLKLLNDYPELAGMNIWEWGVDHPECPNCMEIIKNCIWEGRCTL